MDRSNLPTDFIVRHRRVPVDHHRSEQTDALTEHKAVNDEIVSVSHVLSTRLSHHADRIG